MKRHLLLAFAAVATVFILAAYAQKPASVQQLAVYDAEGKRIGIVSGGAQIVDMLPLVSFKIEAVPFMLFVYRNGFGPGQLVWESENCTGQAYFIVYTADGLSSLQTAAIGPPGNTVYVEDGAPVTKTTHSMSVAGGQSSTCRNLAPFSNPPETVVPMRPLVDMNTLYKPPFTVR
jgi:hypothetical protein